MSEVSLGIKIIADAKGARAEISSLSGDLSKLEATGKKAAGGVDATSKASDAAAKNIRNAGSAADNARKGFDSLGISAGRLAGYFTGAALIGYTKALIEIGDRANSLSARLKLVTNSAEQFASVQGELYRQAQANGASIESQTDLYGKLARATEGTGRSARDLLTITDVIGKQLRISGTSAAQAAGAMLQFGQAAGSGTVHAEEFNSILEGMPTLVQGVAKALGLTVGELKNLVNQGQITSAQWLDAMVRMKEATDKQSEAIAGTFSQAMQRLKNSVFEATAAINNYIGVSKAFASATNAIADGLDRFASTDQIATFTQRIADLRDQIERESGKPFAFLNEEKIGRMKQSLADMEKALADLKKQGETVADPLAEGFGKAKIAIDQVGRSAEATMGQIAAEASRQGVPQAFAIAIAKAESAFRQFNEDGKVLTSSAGALGVMQLMPDTAKRFGVNAKDALDNIKGGVTYLKVLLDQFDGDMKRAAAAYNAGEGNVQKYGGVPPFKETQNYVQKVAAEFDKFKSQYPNGLDFVNAAGQKAEIAQAKSQIESYIQTKQAAAKAAETIAKSQLATENEVLAVRRKAFEEFTKQEAQGLSGSQRTSYLEQAARQESDQIQQQIALKQRAIGIEQQATQAELAGVNQRLAAADKLQLTEAERISLKNQQRQITADLASLQQQSDAVAIQGAGELVQVQQQLAEAQRQEVDAIKASAAARDDYIAKLDQQIQILETGNKLISEETELHKLSAGMAADEAKAWEQTAKAKLSQIQDLEKSQKDQQKNEKAVADQVLRTGQYYQAMVQQAQQAAQGMSQAFGETGAALGNLVVGLAQYQDTMYNIQQRMEALIKSNKENGGTAAQEMEIRTQAANQQLTAQINNYGNLTQAAQSFFDKGTSGYQAMENATKVFRAVELAMTLANYVQMAAAGAAYTMQDVAQSAVRGQAKAVEAVANQASGGDPYSAFPRMAAMAAAMAAIGFAIAGGVSGSSAPRGAVARSTRSDGIVFGDSSAQSNSIKNALELVAKNSTTDLSYSAQMLRSLQNIESAMAGVTNSIIRNVRPADVQGLGTRQTISWDPFAIFMKTTKAITDWGIGAFPQALKTILASGFEGKTFTDVTTSVKFFGMTLSSSTKTMIGDMASETEKQFSLAFKSIADTVREASKAFGTSSDEFNRMVETFVVKFDTTSLKGLKGDELEKAIQGQFSKIADQIAASLNIQGLDEFQRVGEGMFETLVRVADGINTANAELAALGISAVKYSDIQFKQGDVAAEIVRQSIVAFEGLNSGIGGFIDQAVGSAEELIQTYQDLLASRDIMKGLGLQWENLNRTMTDAAGGVSAFRDALESFRDNFYNPGEQLATSQVGLAREFGNLGLVLPDSKEQFRALAESIDTSTESGAELFARVIKLSEAFADAADKAAELEDKYRSYTDPYADFKNRIESIMDDFDAILSGKLGMIEADFANRATLAKYQANAPANAQIDITTARRSGLQAEIQSTLGYLNQTNAEIGRLQDLIARWEGVPKAQGYVAAWRSALSEMQHQAETLVHDLAGKNAELQDINRRIEELQTEIAKNNADIDTSLLGEKLKALTDERRRILREQGNVLVQTMREIWDGVMGVIEDAQRSIAGNIAKLQGGNATSKLLRGDERDATRDLNQYIKNGGKDPQKIADMVIAAQDAIMASFEDRADRLIEKYKKSAEYKLAVKDLEAEAREKIKPIREALRDDIREINAAAREKIKPIREQAQADTKAVKGAAEANIANLQSRSTARIAELTAQMDAAVQALEDRQQAEQDALQATHDARMQQLQDEQQAVIEMLQEGKHYQQQQALDETHYQQQQALDDVHFYQMRAISDEHDAQMRALSDVHQAQLDAINDAHQAQMDALSEQQDAQSDQLRDSQEAASKAFSKQQQAEEKALQKSLDKQMEAAEEQASAAREFADAIKHVAEFAKSLSTSKYSPLSPEAQLAESKRVYEETLAKAKAGDAEAAQKYSAAAQDYLDKSEAYNARNADYAATFAKVQADATALGGTATNADATEAAIERLRESQEAQLEALRESQDAAADSFRKGQEAQTKALQKTFDAQQKALQSALDEQMKSAQRAQEEQTRALQRTQEDESRALQKVQQEESRALQKVQQEESRALQKAQSKELEALRRVQETESKALQKVFSDEMRALQRSQEGQSDAIRTAFQSQIDSIEKRTNDRIDTINNRMDRKIEDIQTKAQKDIDAIRTKADKDIDRVTNHANTRIDNIQNRLQERIDKLALNPPGLQELKDETIAKLQSLNTVLQNTKNEARKQFQEQVEILNSANVLSARQLQQLNNIGASLGAGQTGVPAYAKGGALKPGPAIVGEAGIEPIWFDRGGRVLSNAEAKSALSDGDKKIAQEIAALKEQIQVLTKAQIAANSRMVPAVEALATETAAARRDAKIRPTKPSS